MALSPAQAQALLKFLAQTQIMGADAPLFMECVVALQLIVTHQEDPKENGQAGKPTVDPS